MEKAFDRVPKEVEQWAKRQLGVLEWLVKVLLALYEDSRTCQNKWSRKQGILGEDGGTPGINVKPFPVHYGAWDTIRRV